MAYRPDYVPPDTSSNNTTYPTDLTDEQWATIAPFLPPPDTSGAPITTNVRHAINAMLYRLKTGCQWKMLPRDFQIPWKTVYNWHEKLARLGVWVRIQQALVELARLAHDREAQPSVAMLDSQTVKAAESAGKTSYDGGKKLKGRKRHVLTDSLGLVLAVVVTMAGVSDAHGAELVLDQVKSNKRLSVVYADAAYHRVTLRDYLDRTKSKYRLEIVSLPKTGVGFQVQPKRWVVERTFSWLRSCRLLAREYEGSCKMSCNAIWMRSAMLTMNMYHKSITPKPAKPPESTA